MAKSLKKYMNVDVVAFLEEKMRKNTENFQGDFEYDKKKFEKCVNSDKKEDKVLLWLSRPHGTQCVKEFDAFLRGTEGYHTWQYYAVQEAGSRYVAFAVELTGVQDGVIRGNLYELDYMKHAEMARKEAQPALEVLKTFEDGFVAQAALSRSSYGFWKGFVEEHGPIVDSIGLPTDAILHKMTLAEQKVARDKMRPAVVEDRSVNEILADATQRSHENKAAGSISEEIKGL